MGRQALTYLLGSAAEESAVSALLRGTTGRGSVLGLLVKGVDLRGDGGEHVSAGHELARGGQWVWWVGERTQMERGGWEVVST